jgi:hypothetical protein
MSLLFFVQQIHFVNDDELDGLNELLPILVHLHDENVVDVID